MITIVRVHKPTTSIIGFIKRLHCRYLHRSNHTYTVSFIKYMIEVNNVFILKWRGKRVGDIILAPDSNRLEIEALAIHKDYQRKGIGTAAVEMAEKFGKEYGYDKIYAGSYCEYGAKGFYEKMGFRMAYEDDDGFGKYWDFEKHIT